MRCTANVVIKQDTIHRAQKIGACVHSTSVGVMVFWLLEYKNNNKIVLCCAIAIDFCCFLLFFVGDIESLLLVPDVFAM